MIEEKQQFVAYIHRSIQLKVAGNNYDAFS